MIKNIIWFVLIAMVITILMQTQTQKEYIDGAVDTSKPLLDFKEFITVPKGFIFPEWDEIRTTVGNLLQNYLLVVDPFQGKVPYINKRFFPNDVEKLFIRKWKRSKDDVKNDEVEGEVFSRGIFKVC